MLTIIIMDIYQAPDLSPDLTYHAPDLSPDLTYHAPDLFRNTTAPNVYNRKSLINRINLHTRTDTPLHAQIIINLPYTTSHTHTHTHTHLSLIHI